MPNTAIRPTQRKPYTTAMHTRTRTAGSKAINGIIKNILRICTTASYSITLGCASKYHGLVEEEQIMPPLYHRATDHKKKKKLTSNVWKMQMQHRFHTQYTATIHIHQPRLFHNPTYHSQRPLLERLMSRQRCALHTNQTSTYKKTPTRTTKRNKILTSFVRLASPPLPAPLIIRAFLWIKHKARERASLHNNPTNLGKE